MPGRKVAGRGNRAGNGRGRVVINRMEVDEIVVTAGEGVALRAVAHAGKRDGGGLAAPVRAQGIVRAGRGRRRVQASRAILADKAPRVRGAGDGLRGAIRVRDST